jgi:hypothetical protein
MNDDERDLGHADEQILSPQLRDETLEAAAIGGTIATGFINLIPPNCC